MEPAERVAAFRAFTKYKFPNIRVDFPDGSSDHGSFVLISNTSRYGTFFSFTPNASPIDGYLDVFVFRKRGTLRTILLAIQYLIIFMNRPRKRVLPRALGQHGVYRTREVKISSEATVHLQVDGEFYGALPQSIEVAPEAVDIILPPGRLRRYLRKA